MNVILCILYAGMIAEENKKFAVLGKRIKRLGMHQILVEGLTASEAANFSRGRKAFVRVKDIKPLDEECTDRGF